MLREATDHQGMRNGFPQMDSHVRYIGEAQKKIHSFHPTQFSNKPNKQVTGSQMY